MTAELPIREIGDARLADELAADLCPVCTERDRAAARFVESILFERVTDRGFRAELDAARGFCPKHTWNVLAADRASGSGAGAAILFAAIARVRLAEAQAAFSERGRSGARRVAAARRAATCPVCEHGSGAEASAIARLVALSADDAWAQALGDAPLCLDHLLAIVAAGEPSATWQRIGERQLRRADELRRRLESFAHHSSHDRRHLLTDEERASVEEGAKLLGGSER
ncbi:MAG TPA: DUF6062 family protein [Candidatus Limnocylindrales bacterium]|nr:DUF6062 family protein [Candidatus Limnocylindrales bacterium]